ncbi:YerC/YecD family TrpR-related protein [Hyphobacterium sp.]|uniref:YerC/YecD family TrpR-related protein n=1 Tax=Hyphobacterium sp. TaxID=2004662 RepID=UPI003BA9792D
MRKPGKNEGPEERGALIDALLELKNAEEMDRFLTDLCTPGEIQTLSERWRVARLLNEGDYTYRQISEQTGASTATVTRVARFLSQEAAQGYRLVLDRQKKKQNA